LGPLVCSLSDVLIYSSKSGVKDGAVSPNFATSDKIVREAYLAPEEAELMGRLSKHFLNCGILLPDGAAACISTAMTTADGDAVISAFSDFLSILEVTPTEAGM